MKNYISVTIFFSIILESCSKPHDTPVTTNVYFPKVKTIIQANCLQCHDPGGDWRGRPTDLSKDEMIVQAAGSIKMAVADPPTVTNRHMPQGGQLAQTDIDIIVAWYNKGGKATD